MLRSRRNIPNRRSAFFAGAAALLLAGCIDAADHQKMATAGMAKLEASFAITENENTYSQNLSFGLQIEGKNC